MLKAMRSTVDKPAYFHGGQAEEVFRSQLDQHLADRHERGQRRRRLPTRCSRRQFPQQAKLLADADKQADVADGPERLAAVLSSRIAWPVTERLAC